MTEPSQKQNQITLETDVQYVKGVGPERANAFELLGVKTVGDLVEYFPRDWVFAPKPISIARLKPDMEATIIGQVESVDYQTFRRPAIFEAFVADESGVCRIIWFHGGFLKNQLSCGSVIMVSGKVSDYKNQIQMTNPKFAIIEDPSENAYEYFSGAVYPASAKLSSSHIKRIMRQLIDKFDAIIPEIYPDSFIKDIQTLKRKDAFAAIHNPPDDLILKQAVRRLKFDELFLMQLGLALRRYRMQNFSNAYSIACSEKIDHRIRKRFPFLLTEDQDKVIAEIAADLAKTKPMNRLLQGDVGSGKTVVALYAALAAVANKKQAAIMAPTEILANQHFLSIERYLKDSDVKRVLITGGMTGTKRKEILEQIHSGQIDIVVGTHALLEEDIKFKHLAVAIIDEQHKFGVEQRHQIRKDTTPHCLVMTATPIPRTLAMTAFGDLDVSIIKNSPPGRGEVITRWVAKENRTKAFEFIRQQIKAHKQAYFVYPRIAGSDEKGLIKAAADEWKKLSEKVFPEFAVELLHGQMTSEKKQQVMADFRKNKVNILVSTVVIEVGVDVPNATIMVIETADRFGLAQLHQLRGRIGRGQDKSYCLLFAETEKDNAKERLEIMTRCNDGFEISENDLRIRGPGELFSTRQHGLPDLKIANIIDDYELLVLARKKAFELVEKDPFLTKPENKNLRTILISKFGDSIGLVDIA